jgi:hypothetical protein
MDTSFGTEPGDSYTSKRFLSGWCPECGRRRGADARCKNCDPWWTSPLVQAGVPAVLGVLFLVTSASTLVKQTQKPREPVVMRSTGTSRPVMVNVARTNFESQQRARVASVAPVIPYVAPTFDPAAEALRVQREGAYINAVLRAQDEARRAQQIATRNREYAVALQRRMEAMARARNQRLYSFVLPPSPVSQRSDTDFSRSTSLEQVVTEETVVVPQ